VKESEWEGPNSPIAMLLTLGKLRKFARRGDGSRKLRLFACACCRRIWHLIPDERARRAVEVAERFADGLATEKERATAQAEAYGLIRRESREIPSFERRWAALSALDAVEWAVSPKTHNLRGARYRGAGYCALCAADEGAGEAARPELAKGANALNDPAYRLAYEKATMDEVSAQAAILRDIFGNPFRRVALDPACLHWNGATVRKMAEAIYDDRAFDRLPILADALEEAGCTDRAVLHHCRSGSNHVRGCWVIDLLLGKE
jgi:hypothetical protein